MNLEQMKKVNRDDFIKNNKNFIYTTTYKVCKKNLHWENDDELSIALIAFNKACDTYDDNKGNFFSYASVLIKNSLIDFFKKSKDTPYLIFDSNNDEEKNNHYIDYKVSLNQYEIDCENKNRGEEIMLFTQQLKKYKLDFHSLVKSSPSHIDTRNNLLNLALICSKNEDILTYIKTKKLLPITQIALITNNRKKYIEKWRRYILTLVILLSSNDFPYIKSYLNIKVGDNYE
ncbi:sigma factor [Clostridium brassicae]|uniref:RNA polymerase sigma factor SigI n=1 Tax=Clostridium brassicae TaxID=2999072 RepID=A0ABT4DD20_9CLOT|nr:sigma factor [Clostridium brassicae]MCY6960187.1 sigma factor [Clostridium brassicae]